MIYTFICDRSAKKRPEFMTHSHKRYRRGVQRRGTSDPQEQGPGLTVIARSPPDRHCSPRGPVLNPEK